MRPSAVGPTELKPARLPARLTAATETTRTPSAGAPNVFWNGSGPWLPAELTTTMPRAAARAAARVVTAVSPFMSCAV